MYRLFLRVSYCHSVLPVDTSYYSHVRLLQIFEEEAVAWDDKLNRLRILLDTWVEVQRKWLYLEGVFSGSQDIQMLLPSEHQRFKGIDTEFKAIMKKADSTKVVLEVMRTRRGGCTGHVAADCIGYWGHWKSYCHLLI